MSKSVAKNYTYNLLMQVLSVVFPIILTPYLSRVLNADGVGIFNYTLSVVTIFTSFQTLGLNLFGQKEIAFTQNNPQKRAKVFSNLVFINALFSFISLLAFTIFSLTQGAKLPIYLLWAIQIVSIFFDIAWFYKGIEEFKSILIRNFIIKVLCLISVFIFVKAPSQVWIYVLIYSMSNLLGNMTLWKNIRKYTSFSFKHIDKKILINYAKNLFVFFIPQVSTAIYETVDKTMIGAILSDNNQVGYYSQPQRIVGLSLTVITSLSVVILPKIALLITKKDTSKIKKYIEKSLQFTTLIGIPLILGLILISNSFIPLFLGEGFDESIIILSLLAPIIGIIGISNITGMQILIPTNRQKDYNKTIICGLIINITLNAILIPAMKARGACLATLISEMSILTLQLYYTRHYIDVLKIFKNSQKHIAAGSVMFIISSLIKAQISSINLQLLILIPVSAVIYLLVLLLLRDEMLFEIMNKIIRKGKK